MNLIQKVDFKAKDYNRICLVVIICYAVLV